MLNIVGLTRRAMPEPRTIRVISQLTVRINRQRMSNKDNLMRKKKEEEENATRVDLVPSW
jgi:acyl-[acyl carrier protein]--UDP-N-acetylglucosamine O-acyltransferase